MEDKLAVVLEKLADKLEITTEYLWAVLVKQAQISAVVDLLILGCLVAATAVVFNKSMTMPADTYDEKEKRLFARIWAVVFCVLVALSGLCTIGSIVAGFVNPEYWALQQILNKL
jgi:hypothetical protein